MELIQPSLEYFESYKQALLEFERDEITGFWRLFGSPDEPEMYLQKILNYQHKPKDDNGLVPASVYWLVDNGQFVGHVSIRHELNSSLKRIGGHIGYAIRPSANRKGYGSSILKLALPIARSLGIQEALVTCDKSNIASRKIIEKNGGVLQQEADIDGKSILYYSVSL